MKRLKKPKKRPPEEEVVEEEVVEEEVVEESDGGAADAVANAEAAIEAAKAIPATDDIGRADRHFVLGWNRNHQYPD